jgi:hypothetical protein
MQIKLQTHFQLNIRIWISTVIQTTPIRYNPKLSFHFQLLVDLPINIQYNSHSLYSRDIKIFSLLFQSWQPAALLPLLVYLYLLPLLPLPQTSYS